MELFHEFRNRSVLAFMILAERIANGEVFSKNEFETEYYKLANDEKRMSKVFFENVFYNCIFDIRDDKRIGLYAQNDSDCDIHISNIPLETEKKWLNTALNDRLQNLFFSEEDLPELGFDFSKYHLYYRNIDDEWRKNEDISSESAKNFRMILQAINEKKSISYTYNQDRSEGTPVKIEYDERTCKIYIIVYDGSRFIKADISKLADIQLSGDVADTIPNIKEDMEKKKRSVVFTVTDHKNRKAIERALLAFSVYDHVVEPIDEKTARFNIQYYSMDRDILLKEILAFGADIIVESPKYMVERIVEILKRV